MLDVAEGTGQVVVVVVLSKHFEKRTVRAGLRGFFLGRDVGDMPLLDFLGPLWVEHLIKRLGLTPRVPLSGLGIDLLVFLRLFEQVWMMFLQPEPLVPALVETEVASRAGAPVVIVREPDAALFENAMHTCKIDPVLDERV